MNKATSPSVNLEKVLAGAQLPALPQSAIRLLELSQDPTNGPAEFAAPIESDPGLTGQVLRFVNSSYFGFSREISNVKSAITLVGIRTIKNFALWSAVFSLMPNPRCGPFELKSLWTDSLRRAMFARTVGTQLGMKEAEDAFTAALLQDMSVPLLAKEAPEVYAKLLKGRDDGHVRLSDLERQSFGWTHAEAAGMMARQWNLPDTFVTLIEQHLDIDQWLSEARPEPAKVAVALSALLPATPDSRWTECQRFEECFRKAIPSGSPTIPEVLALIDDQFMEFAPILKLAKPKKSLVEAYQEVTTPTS
jgi:HD-like signal output (HDOD) protein